MAGLDMVKGPHWSQILTLFGQNGTMSDILKDRTQVQLKDKARNLKLFFLKTNSEMPYYLQCVTGELKTRAPSQAARKEAEEKARLNSEEEHARLHGIATHAQGLHNNGRNTSSPVPISGTSTSTRASPVTPGVGVTGPAFTGTAVPPVRNAPIAAATSPSIKSEPPDPLPVYPARVERPNLPVPQQPAQPPPVSQPIQRQAQQPIYQPKVEPPQHQAANQLKVERPAQPAMQKPETQPTGQPGMGEQKIEPRSDPTAQLLLQSMTQAASQQPSQSHAHPTTTASSNDTQSSPPPPVPSQETSAPEAQTARASLSAPSS